MKYLIGLIISVAILGTITTPISEENIITPVKTEERKEIVQEVNYYQIPLSEDIQDIIFKECEKHNLEPSLVLALIWQESTYKANNISRSGESFGLMQLHRSVHNELAQELQISDFNALNAKHNILAGTLKLKQCIDIWIQDYSKEEAIYRGLNSYNFGYMGYLKHIDKHGIQWKYADEILEKQKIIESRD